jgi:hypothetical protein
MDSPVCRDFLKVRARDAMPRGAPGAATPQNPLRAVAAGQLRGVSSSRPRVIDADTAPPPRACRAGRLLSRELPLRAQPSGRRPAVQPGTPCDADWSLRRCRRGGAPMRAPLRRDRGCGTLTDTGRGAVTHSAPPPRRQRAVSAGCPCSLSFRGADAPHRPPPAGQPARVPRLSKRTLLQSQARAHDAPHARAECRISGLAALAAVQRCHVCTARGRPPRRRAFIAASRGVAADAARARPPRPQLPLLPRTVR